MKLLLSHLKLLNIVLNTTEKNMRGIGNTFPKLSANYILTLLFGDIFHGVLTKLKS